MALLCPASDFTPKTEERFSLSQIFRSAWKRLSIPGIKQGRRKKRPHASAMSTVSTSTTSEAQSVVSDAGDQQEEEQIEKDRTGNSIFSTYIQRETLDDEYRVKLLEICGQRAPVSFHSQFPRMQFKVNRFDSGTYSEVYKATFRNNENEVMVVKVIRTVAKNLQNRLIHVSFAGTETYEEAYNELVISKELSNFHDIDKPYATHCFPRIIESKVVKGAIPSYFLDTRTKGKRDSPEKSEPFQKYPNAPREYLVIVMKFGGEPLWKAIKHRTVDGFQLLSIAKQVTFGLAVAESQRFEHRDLHISNVLLKQTDKEYIPFIIDNQEYDIETCGVKAYIIDVTFSRISIGNTVYYKDMSDILRKKSPGDKVTLQNEVYEKMVEETANQWDAWTPRTNVFWLNYLYRTMLKSHAVKHCAEDEVRKTLGNYAKYSERCSTVSGLVDYIIATSSE